MESYLNIYDYTPAWVYARKEYTDLVWISMRIITVSMDLTEIQLTPEY